MSPSPSPTPAGAPEAGLLLVNMGGPTSIAEVRPYLEAIFRDRAILPLPAILRHPLARTIARRRAPRVAERYALIGGGPPLARWTEQQAELVAQALAERQRGWPVWHAFRYTRPSIDEAIEQAARAGVRRLLLIPLFPHYTRAMTGSVVERGLEAATAAGLRLELVRAFADEPAIIACWTAQLRRALEQAGEQARVLFVAHGIPERSVRQGEDYPVRVAATAKELARCLPAGSSWSLAFQSRLGPVRWTRPYLDDELARLCRDRRPLVLVPLSFVADCLETLYDLDVVAAAQARAAGLRAFVRAPAFNDDRGFASALAAIACRALEVAP